MRNAAGNQHDSAGGGEQNQKRRRQHEPRDERGSGGESSADIAVKRAGARALRAVLENPLHGLVGARKRCRAIVRANQAGCGWRLDAVVAQCPSAIRADGHGLDVVRGAFHGL